VLSCREVTRLTASDELSGASLRLRLAVRFHRMLCGACRRYARQIRSLGTLARKCSEPGPEGADTLKRLRGSILGKGLDEDRLDSPSSDSPD